MLKFTNRQLQSIEFKDGTRFRLFEVEGLEGATVENYTQKSPYQDGTMHIQSILESLEITLTFGIFANNKAELLELKRYVTEVFNKNLGLGLLTHNRFDIERQINVIIDGSIKFPNGKINETETFQRGTLTLLAPDPYWKSPVIQNEPMAAFISLFEFPFEDEFEIGMEGHETVIYNRSDAAVPIEIEINGPTVNPCLTNLTTGEMIRVKRELQTDDVLYINTANGNKQVLLNGQNVFHWLDIQSTFFKLQMGENILKYTADRGTDTATLNIKLQELYNAV